MHCRAYLPGLENGADVNGVHAEHSDNGERRPQTLTLGAQAQSFQLKHDYSVNVFLNR